MQATMLIQLLTQKTGAILGKEFSVSTDDRLVIKLDTIRKIVKLYLGGDREFKPLIAQIRIEAPDLERVLAPIAPSLFERSISKVLDRCLDICEVGGDRGKRIARLYFFLFYHGIALKFKLGEDLPYSLFHTLTGEELNLSAASQDSPELEWLQSLVFEDVLASAIDPRITSVERYRELIGKQAWLEFWQTPK